VNQQVSAMKKFRTPSGDFVVDREAQPEKWPVKRARLRCECMIEGGGFTKINQCRSKTIDVRILNDLRLVVVHERIRQGREIEDGCP